MLRKSLLKAISRTSRMNQKTAKLIRKYCKILNQNEKKVKRVYKGWHGKNRLEFIMLMRKVVEMKDELKINKENRNDKI